MCQRFDATILIERPPEIEFRDGLFHVTDRIGELVIRRCFTPHTFTKLARAGQRALVEFRSADVVRLAG